ncbi:Alpha/beta hydrolase family protein [Burkholderia sp. 8Y]|uniref:alpha/beta fold hydrolase n=1 Tax=Burkholderia sp. 8Y TaxID=2653133 RepID=UPI0012F1BB53|nr:alpha/beta fold hydrolase [Burkholderia sp. 8Y]VXC90828.1 Alpha/beta hydrolase family protein [Burkholderia sp. 8Y]
MLLPLNQRTISYDIVGTETGPVVVFSHSLAADLGLWAEQVPALLAAGYRVLRTDLRGHGGSTPTPAPYTIDLLADDVIDVLDALRIERAHFVGLSIGGMIGQSLGLRHASRFKSLMLCDTQSESPPDAATFWGPMIESITQANSLEPIADRTMQRWLTEDYKRAHPVRWKQIRDTVAGCTPTGYIGCAGAIGNFNFTDRLSTVKTPVLVACGTQDPRATPAESRRIASLFANGNYAEFEGAKHVPNVEQPEKFNSVLLQWLPAHA